MSQATSSEQIQLLIAGYVLGDLSSDEAQELARLMAENPMLAEEISALQAVSETMQDITDEAPPSHLRSRVVDANSQQTESPAITSSPPTHTVSPSPVWDRRRGLWIGMGAIAAALIAALGINNYRLWNALQVAQREINQVNLVTYSLTHPDATSTASASVVVNPNTLEAQVTAQNLPTLPPEKVYAVWTLPEPDVPATTDAKGAILAGVFQVDGEGAAATTLTVPAVHRSPEWVAKVAITVEDAASPQQHTGSIVLITQ